MKNLLLILTTLLLTACSPTSIATPHIANHQTDQTQAILQLDTGGHTALIKDIITTDSGEIISASEDKTIRVWDAKTGKEKRKILGKIGAGAEGKIYAIALSPDKRYLAVGGLLGTYTGKKSEKDEEEHWIRIYNYQTGKLQQVLKSHTNAVVDLSFSPDGAYLISGSGDTTAKIWSARDNFTLYDTINFHKHVVYAVKIIKTKGKYFAITAGLDNQIALYDMQRKKVVKHHRLNYKLISLAVSNRLGHIAVCGFGREIVVYDFSLNFIKKIKSKTKPIGLNYSKDSRYLIAGIEEYPFNVNIYKTNNYTPFSTFKKHTNGTMAVNFIEIEGQTYAVSGGGDNNEIYIWDIATKRVKTKIEGVGDTVWRVGINGDSVAWGNIGMTQINKHAKLQKEINLKTFQIKNIDSQSSFNRISTVETRDALSLQHTKGGDYGYNGVLNIIKNGKVIHQIIRDSTTGYRHNCYGWYKNFIVSGGMNGRLKIYNKDGKEVASLIGHTGEIWSIALDGDRLVSGSSDQTIRVWDLSKLKMNSEKRKINEKLISDSIKKYHISREKILKKAKMNNYLYNYIYKSRKIYPTLNLFISKNNDWIAWTPNGFFDASKNGAKYIGYHINHGAEHEAEFFDMSRFKKQFYRPDLIQKAISGEDISHYAQGIDIDSLLSAGLPPKVEILTNSKTIEAESSLIGVNVCDEGGGFENLNFYVDGKAIKYLSSTKAFRVKKESNGACMVIEQKISVPSGEHTIAFDATNKKGNILSNRPTITVVNNKKIAEKPNLHLLTLSINDYKDNSLDLKFPNNDADELSSKLKKIGKSVFKTVNSYALKDKQVTKEQIEAKVKEIAQKIDVNDVFVLYISGHGITNDADGDYYFIPYGCANGSDVTKNAINQQVFKQIMSQIKAVKSVILLDTCQSGSMASKELLSTSVNRFGGNVGSAIIAGASSKQNAIDGYKKHGIFTYTLLDAMNNKKVYSFDDKLSINEIAEYVKYKLPTLAKEAFSHEQKPTIYMNGDTTFSLGGL